MNPYYNICIYIALQFNYNGESGMDVFFTRISKKNMEQIIQKDMSARDIIQFLENGALYRSFSDILKMAYPYDDLYEKLVHGLVEISGKDLDSVSRKVRNWIRGNNTPQNREQLFQICFILGLDEYTSDKLISSSSETGIHYRNPKELVYAYCLRVGESYLYARKLYEQMEEIYIKENKNRKDNYSEESDVRYTKQIRDEFTLVENEDDLNNFFKNYSQDLGTIHETAYRKFIQLLNYLQKPGEDEELYSIGKTVDEYLRMNIPNTRETKGFSYLQKAIKKNWPTERELLNMKKRNIDVSRKAMLLLLLVTEDFMSAEETKESTYSYEDLMDDDPDICLEVRISQINLFLNLYGMNLLDPGNPFDCIILYGLRAAYGDAAVSDEIKNALAVLFCEENMPPKNKVE